MWCRCGTDLTLGQGPDIGQCVGSVLDQSEIFGPTGIEVDQRVAGSWSTRGRYPDHMRPTWARCHRSRPNLGPTSVDIWPVRSGARGQPGIEGGAVWCRSVVGAESVCGRAGIDSGSIRGRSEPDGRPKREAGPLAPPRRESGLQSSRHSPPRMHARCGRRFCGTRVRLPLLVHLWASHLLASPGDLRA